MVEVIYELTQTKAMIKSPQKAKPKKIGVIHKQTPLQPKELEILANCPDVNLACSQLKLKQRPSVPLEIIRAYETLKDPKHLGLWLQNPHNLAMHRLATQANRSSWISRQSSSWGSQYSSLVNFWLLAQPQYRKADWIPHLKPLFHPDLWTAVNCYDPQLELTTQYIQELRLAVIQYHNKAPHQIYRPHIANPYNLVDLNWIAILELWVCTPELQHPNHLTEFLCNHKPLSPQPLFENQ